jgi:toxin ParE1/3/4
LHRAGDDFLAAVAEALVRLEAGPEGFPNYYRVFRRVLTRRFPYKVFFRIEGEAVIVFRILHGAQDHPRHLR